MLTLEIQTKTKSSMYAHIHMHKKKTFLNLIQTTQFNFESTETCIKELLY